MQYLRDNAERLVIKWMITEKPELIDEMNLKQWFWSKEGRTLAWAILKAHREGSVIDTETITNYVNWGMSKSTIEDLDLYMKIDLVDSESMQQVITYFKFMRMFFELYEHREGFSPKEIEVMQKIAERIKKQEVNQKVLDIIYRIYESKVGFQWHNKLLKQQVTAAALHAKEAEQINKYI